MGLRDPFYLILLRLCVVSFACLLLCSFLEIELGRVKNLARNITVVLYLVSWSLLSVRFNYKLGCKPCDLSALIS